MFKLTHSGGVISRKTITLNSTIEIGSGLRGIFTDYDYETINMICNANLINMTDTMVVYDFINDDFKESTNDFELQMLMAIFACAVNHDDMIIELRKHLFSKQHNKSYIYFVKLLYFTTNQTIDDCTREYINKQSSSCIINPNECNIKQKEFVASMCKFERKFPGMLPEIPMDDYERYYAMETPVTAANRIAEYFIEHPAEYKQFEKCVKSLDGVSFIDLLVATKNDTIFHRKYYDSLHAFDLSEQIDGYQSEQVDDYQSDQVNSEQSEQVDSEQSEQVDDYYKPVPLEEKLHEIKRIASNIQFDIKHGKLDQLSECQRELMRSINYALDEI